MRTRAPRAQVTIVSYPWIMPEKVRSCPEFPVAPADACYTYSIQAALNDAIRRAAAATGVEYIDATTPSVGHDSCQPVGVRWIEPLLGSTQPVPVHPNALGQREIAGIVARYLR